MFHLDAVITGWRRSRRAGVPASRPRTCRPLARGRPGCAGRQSARSVDPPSATPCLVRPWCLSGRADEKSCRWSCDRRHRRTPSARGMLTPVRRTTMQAAVRVRIRSAPFHTSKGQQDASKRMRAAACRHAPSTGRRPAFRGRSSDPYSSGPVAAIPCRPGRIHTFACTCGSGGAGAARVRAKRVCSMQIRAARPSDLTEIQAIYAHHVLHGTGTFEEIPPSVEEMGGRLAKGPARRILLAGRGR